MKIVLVNGGLANQMYQYIFARYLEITTGEKVYLDVVPGTEDIHNGFELRKVFPNAPMTLLEEAYDPEVWALMDMLRRAEGSQITSTLDQNGFRYAVLVEGGQFPKESFFKDPALAEQQVLYIDPKAYHTEEGVLQETSKFKNVYYAGYWIYQYYFQQVAEQLNVEMAFPPLADQKNIDYQEQMLKTYSVAVHVRRGDFLEERFLWGLPADYYAGVISEAKKEFKHKQNVTFFVFSDDLPWCENNKKAMGFRLQDRVVFVDGNTGNGMNYVDMQLMCSCRALIASRSSFCVAVTYLPNRLERTFVAPDRMIKMNVD